MSKKFLPIIIFLLGIFCFSLKVEAYIAPGVYIKELNLNYQDLKAGDKVTGNFTIWNSEEYIVSNISQEFNIFIPDEEGNPKATIGSYLTPEKLQLLPDQKKTINFSYQLPQNLLSGNYQFRFSLWSGTGVLMNWQDQEIKISGNEKFLEISNPRVVKGETENLPLIGVRFSLTEAPKIRFDIENKSSLEIKGLPKITVFEREINLAKAKETEEKESLILAPKEKKTIDFEMPTLEKPESYLANLEFYDSSDGSLVSNNLLFRWVIEGKGAEVLDIKSAQGSYLKGNTAEITVCYVGPADSSEIGESKLLVEIYNEKGELSGSASKIVSLDKEGCILVEVPIEKEVKRAEIRATISQDEATLEEYSTGLLKEEGVEKTGEEEEYKPLNLSYIIGGVILLIIVIILLYKFLKKPKKS